MNITEILLRLGWDIYALDNLKNEYKIALSKRRKDYMRGQIKAGKMGYDGDMEDFVTVKIGEVCFNGSGDLYVEFIDVDTGKSIDVYEHNNMHKYELY